MFLSFEIVHCHFRDGGGRIVCQLVCIEAAVHPIRGDRITLLNMALVVRTDPILHAEHVPVVFIRTLFHHIDIRPYRFARSHLLPVDPFTLADPA